MLWGYFLLRLSHHGEKPVGLGIRTLIPGIPPEESGFVLPGVEHTGPLTALEVVTSLRYPHNVYVMVYLAGYMVNPAEIGEKLLQHGWRKVELADGKLPDAWSANGDPKWVKMLAD